MARSQTKSGSLSQVLVESSMSAGRGVEGRQGFMVSKCRYPAKKGQSKVHFSLIEVKHDEASRDGRRKQS